MKSFWGIILLIFRLLRHSDFNIHATIPIMYSGPPVFGIGFCLNRDSLFVLNSNRCLSYGSEHPEDVHDDRNLLIR